MPSGSLIVASMIGLLTFSSGVSAKAQDQSPQQKSSQSVPDAPVPQKKPAPKPPPDTSSDQPAGDAAPAQPAQKDANAFPEDVSRAAAKSAAPPEPTTSTPPAQPAKKDDNAFPEDVSRAAAKAADPQDGSSSPAGTSDSNPPAGGQHSTADDNPFPDSVSRDAARQSGNEPAPTAAPKPTLPPGFSSSQSEGSAAAQVTAPEANPPLAQKDIKVGEFYLKTGDFQGALLRYKEATAADPTNVDAIFGLAETQRSLGKTADAANNYQLYLDIVPNGPKAKEAIKALKTLRPGK